MNNAQARLKWLVEFSGTNLDALEEWERMKLRQELARFSGLGEWSAKTESRPLGPDVESVDSNLASSTEIKKWQQWARSALTEGMTIGARFDFTIRRSAPGRILGSMNDLFVWGLFHALSDSELNSRIADCPECGRTFLRVRKQKYCSRKCINRVSRRDWLQKPKNRKKESQWAHARYVRRVQKKTNGKVRVEARPEKGRKA